MAPFDPETERIRRIYDRAPQSSPPGAEADMRWACSRAEGETLEVGIGRGPSLEHYPPQTRLTAVDVSQVSLDQARDRARELGREIELRQADATALPFPDAGFDTVVFCFVLCTVPREGKAVAEAVRVLRPGGRLVYVEHVKSSHLAVRVVQRLLEPIDSRLLADHLLRQPAAHVAAQGLEVERVERHFLGMVERLVARKPE